MKKEHCILVAEDDEDDVLFLRRAFTQAEIHQPLHIAPDGQAAIDYLSGSGNYSDRIQHPLPRLLLLDLKMPRRTGMDVLKWLRSQEALRALPTIMLSSSTHPAEIEEAYQNGVNAFVTKPSGISERAELAKAIKAFWLTFSESPPMR